jgi:hypothetical protein
MAVVLFIVFSYIYYALCLPLYICQFFPRSLVALGRRVQYYFDHLLSHLLPPPLHFQDTLIGYELEVLPLTCLLLV